jgi:carboxyl-terminal processing protease
MKIPLQLVRSLASWVAVLATGWTAAAASLSPAQLGKITQVVGTLLELRHFKQTQLDNSVSQTFLRNYLDALDANHMFFLQSDLDEFEQRYGKTLDDAVHNGDTAPAYEIYKRFLERLEQRNRQAQAILDQPLTFDGDEMFMVSRTKAPWPKDAADAEALWRARLKSELLQDKLAHAEAQEKARASQPSAPPAADAAKPTPDATKPAAEAAKPFDPEGSIKTIRKRYDRLVKTWREFDTEDVLQIYLTALAHAYDPHSDYMSPTEASNFDIQNVKLSLSGIGALLRTEDGYPKIVSLVPGGPADLSKQVKPNDRIVAVAQGETEPVDTVEMKLSKVVEMIRGKRGTEVRLTIIPASSPDGTERRVIRLVRDEIKLTEQYAKARVIERRAEGDQTVRVGVINLPQFYENCAEDVERLIERLKRENVSAMVLDLRRNGGGLLPEAIALSGLFLKKGPVVQVKGLEKRAQILRDDDPKVVYDGPLVVLTSHMSASASEIVAAALQDYERALIVGDQATHGKGTVQTLQSLNQFIRPAGLVPDAGKLKFTISKFYRVNGGTTQKLGVKPDVSLPSPYDSLEIGEASLPNCLEADSIAPAEFTSYGYVKPFVAELQQRSTERVNRNPDFGYLKEDIEAVRRQRAEKTVSLNEAKRNQERQTNKARLEARKKERAQRRTPADRVFELTLEAATQDKPLQALASPNQAQAKEDAAVAAAATDADEDAAEDSDTADPKLDVQLQEALSVTLDYMRLSETQHARVSGSKRLAVP